MDSFCLGRNEMKSIIIENCKSSAIIGILKLILNGRNTKINVFQKELGLSYSEVKSYLKLLNKAGIFSECNHYCMVELPDGRHMRYYKPFEILVSDDELKQLIEELEEHFGEYAPRT